MTTHVLFLAAFLLLPLVGLITWRLESVRRLNLAGRIAVAGAAGAVITAVLMALLSLLGIHWSRTLLFPLLGAIAATGGYFARRDSPRAERRSVDWIAIAGILGFAVLTCYGLLSARESAGDLMFFWGPKGVHFFRTGEISVPFLANKRNPNSDYPPLLPLLYAWAHMVAHQFSWWSALLASGVFIFGAVAIVRACSGDDAGALLLAASLSWAMAYAFAAGGADPPLVFFESLVLSALVFLKGRDSDILAAIGLAGCVFCKIEGATFLIAVVLAMIIVERTVKRALLIAAPAIVILASWFAFLNANNLIYGYGGAKMKIYFEIIPKTVLQTAKVASYGLFWLPFIVPVVLIILGRSRRAVLPAVVAVLSVGAALFYYVHSPDPTWWIASSAPRVLMTPLTAIVIAAVASGRVLESPGHGVVPQREEA